MKPEITSIFGAALQQEVSSLLENLGGMTDIIEANFSQIKDILQIHKDEVIKAITKEKNKEISELKTEIKAKDVQINNLKLKEGELNGKQEMIASLNARINEQQQSLDALAHRGDCHNQENPLQAIVDNMAAKNLELEAKLMQMTEKATNAAAELQEVKARLESQM
jgi:Na+/phosphate symporter